MKDQLKRKLPIIIAIIVTSIFTIIFAALSIIHNDSFMFRILTQGSLSIAMLLNGVNSFVYQKHKSIALFQLIVFGFLIFVIISTIHTGLLKNAF
ncbi:MAG: hypothetical protein ABF633_15595 [Clostridium sp.]|uniref:hypothetical protein n=1 Tax=Clostridium sp. TaxID=1506 RepID=UPI0039E9EE45